MTFTVAELLKEQADRLKLELVAGEKSLGRRIAVSELNQRLRGQGYFAAQTFNQKLIEQMRAKGAPRGPA